MATTFESAPSIDQQERRFFFVMAIAMAIAIVAGFAFNLGMGRSSFSVPIIYHVHAFVFFGWVALYLAQTGLIASGNAVIHRRLGWLALAWVPAMVVLGFMLTMDSIKTRGGPFFFDTNEFLFCNIAGLLAFAGIILTGIAMRKRTDWHRRLMYCGMALLTGPGIGRLMPNPFLIPWAWWVSSIGVPLIFPIIGMIMDKRRIGRVHPAWFWAVGTLLASQMIADLIAYSPVGIDITHSVTEGTPGALRDMRAHFP